MCRNLRLTHSIPQNQICIIEISCSLMLVESTSVSLNWEISVSLHIFSREDELLSGKHRSLDPRASRVNSLVLWVMIRRKWCGWILSRGLWLYWFEETGWKTFAWKEFNSCQPTKPPPVSLFRHDVTWKPSVTHWCNVTLNFSVQVPGREDSNSKLNIWNSFFWYLFL